VATESAAIIKQKRSGAFMVQCMMTAGFFFGTNASRNTAPCNVVLTMRPSLLGGSNRRRDQLRHSESEKQSETTGFNFWRGIGPASFLSSVICDRACEMIPAQKHQSVLRPSFFSFVGDSLPPRRRRKELQTIHRKIPNLPIALPPHLISGGRLFVPNQSLQK
jgi:hypothetical protein